MLNDKATMQVFELINDELCSIDMADLGYLYILSRYPMTETEFDNKYIKHRKTLHRHLKRLEMYGLIYVDDKGVYRVFNDYLIGTNLSESVDQTDHDHSIQDQDQINQDQKHQTLIPKEDLKQAASYFGPTWVADELDKFVAQEFILAKKKYDKKTLLSAAKSAAYEARNPEERRRRGLPGINNPIGYFRTVLRNILQKRQICYAWPSSSRRSSNIIKLEKEYDNATKGYYKEQLDMLFKEMNQHAISN